ncbi:cTAGE family member 4 [Plecturocebus cupreus]
MLPQDVKCNKEAQVCSVGLRLHSGPLQLLGADSGSRPKAVCSPPLIVTSTDQGYCSDRHSSLGPMEEPGAGPGGAMQLLLNFLLFSFCLGRNFRSVRSWLYVGREEKLAVALSGLIEGKCKLFEKFSLIQKEYEGYEVESSLKNASFEKEATETQSLEAACEKLNRSNSKFEDEILCLEKELKEEKSKHSKQDELMADISKMIQSL